MEFFGDLEREYLQDAAYVQAMKDIEHEWQWEEEQKKKKEVFIVVKGEKEKILNETV